MTHVLSRNPAKPESDTIAFDFTSSSFQNLSLVTAPCYIDALPEELLGQIFSCVRDGYLSSRDNFGWAGVCLPVSRRWRHVGISTSELWRYIFEDRPERLRVVLSRCQVPLIVNWRCSFLNFEVRKEWLAILRNQVDRVEEIRIECDCHTVGCSLTNRQLEDKTEQKLDSESPAFPLLKKLSIFDVIESVSLESILQNSPKLVELNLIGGGQFNIAFPTQLGESTFLSSLKCLILKGEIQFGNVPSYHSLSFPVLSELTVALTFRSGPASTCTIIEAICSKVPTNLSVEVPQNSGIAGNSLEKISAACQTFHASFVEKGPIHSLQCLRAYLVLPYEWQSHRYDEFTIKLTLASKSGYSTTFYMTDDDSFTITLQGVNLSAVEEIQLSGYSHTHIFMFEEYDFPKVRTIIFSEFSIQSYSIREHTTAFRLPSLHSIVLRDCSNGSFPVAGFLKALYQFGENQQSLPKLVIEGTMPPNFDPIPLEHLNYVTHIEVPSDFHSSWNEDDEISDWDAFSEPDVLEESDSYDTAKNGPLCDGKEDEDEDEDAEDNSDVGTWLLSPDVPLLDDSSEDGGDDPDWQLTIQDPDQLPIAQNFEATTFDYRSYAIIWGLEDRIAYQHTAFHICVMPEYLKFSQEELRFRAYSQGHKNPPPGTKWSPFEAPKEIIPLYQTFTTLELYCQHSQEELRLGWIQADRPNHDLTSVELLAQNNDKRSDPILPTDA
ncbi:hypothetical protein DL96DRAFT_1814912 [Flagelloscypha sp. PMI_526]|nr:hypothetical protein DL96DRAFT_1814912 [Flagelloscypha sp. PMI_526]